MWTRFIVAFSRDEDGQDLIEYSLLLAFVALASVAVLTHLSANFKTIWSTVSDALSDAVTAAS